MGRAPLAALGSILVLVAGCIYAAHAVRTGWADCASGRVAP